jgi:peptidoglycan/xylan/chitin deacetylase (PgdA/CDA1 family)
MTHARRAALIICGVLLVPVFYASAAFGPNLVQNGNLETASSNASIPEGWNTDKWGTITATFLYPVAGNGSAKAAKVQVTSRRSGDAKWFFNHIPVEAGKVYQYSDDYSSNKATNVTIEYKLQNGSMSYVWLASVPSSGNVWKTFTKQFTAPSNAVSFTVLHTLGAVGTLTIDTVLVQKEGDDNPPPPPPPPPPPGDVFSEGMVTLSFDDSWLSQYTTALPIIEAAGIKATFYLTTEPIQKLWSGFMTTAQVKDLVVRGHEIGGHTVTHNNLTNLSSSKVTQELVNSKNYLQNLTGVSVTTLAYPYGAYSNTVKNAAKNAGYTTARSVEEDTLNLPTTDKLVLKGLIPELNTPMSQVKAAIDEAKAKKQWLIIGLHEINNSGDQYSNTPAQLQEIVNYITSAGVKTVTVKEGTALMAE